MACASIGVWRMVHAPAQKGGYTFAKSYRLVLADGRIV